MIILSLLRLIYEDDTNKLYSVLIYFTAFNDYDCIVFIIMILPIAIILLYGLYMNENNLNGVLWLK